MFPFAHALFGDVCSCLSIRLVDFLLTDSFLFLNQIRYKGTYCSQEVAIKILKAERINTDMQREFAQEVFIMR